MPFSGGGGGQLTNHVHDNTPLQGGPLNFNNTTIGGMNSGDLTYSDGAALQQLAISAPNDQLRVSAGNIPEWFTPAGAASTFTTLYDSGNIGVAGNIDSGTFASHPILYISIYAALSVAAAQGIKFNNNAGLVYNQRDGRNGVWNTATNLQSVLYTFGTTADWTQSQWWIQQRPTANKLISGFITQDVGAGSSPSQDIMSAQFEDAVNNITRVEITNGYSGITSSCQIGSRMIVLGAG